MSGYIGVEPVTQATKVRTFGTLVEASTTIPVAGGFSPGNIEVYINGDYVLPTDYDESDGLNVVFGITLTAGTDYVVIEARQFLVADTWSKAEADTRYAEIAGGADANFTAMPQVGGDPIVESGSNADGEFTKWADGTQITSQQFLLGGTTGATVNGFYAVDQNSENFPVSFLSTPKISTSVASNLTDLTYAIVTSDNGLAPTTSTNTGRIRGLIPQSTGAVGVDVIAYGRWK